jgi:hypothetical protein
MASADTLHDGDFTKAVSIGAQRYEYPFRNNGDRVSAVFEEDYWQTKTTFVPMEYSTPHETLRDFYLIGETDPVEFMAGLYKFTRTYARVPRQQQEGSSILVPMPEPGAGGGTEIPFTGPLTNAFVFYPNGDTYQYGKGVAADRYFYGENTYYAPLKLGNGLSYSGNQSNAYHIIPGRTTFQVTNHSFTNGAPVSIIFTAASPFAAQKWFSTLSDWEYVNANAINGPYRTEGNMVSQGNVYFTQANTSVGTWGKGSRYIRCTRTTDFYLPGVTQGVATLSDIPLPADQSGSAEFLDALLAGTGTINVQVGELTRWRDSPIYMITKTTVNVVDII